MKQIERSIIAILMGVPALIVFGYCTRWEAAVALLFILWADNIDKVNK